MRKSTHGNREMVMVCEFMSTFSKTLEGEKCIKKVDFFIFGINVYII